MIRLLPTYLFRSLLLLGLLLTTTTGLSAHEAVNTLAQYFDFLTTGNLESAREMWTSAAIERSERFGISYTDVLLKTDCASPIINRFDAMRDHLQPPVKHITSLADGFVRMHYSAVVAGEEVTHTYYAAFDGQYYWLTYPQEYFGRGWNVVESRYFRIHAHPLVERFLNRAVLEEADRFVERIADSLRLSRSDLHLIQRKKIEYFYCDSDETVMEITGARTKGTVDLASNDVISAFFPHLHEICHLLVNIKLRELPLMTHPLLREGLAVHYGGRWGKAPDALLGLGVYLLDMDIVDLDSLLTPGGFSEQATADVAYPVAGLFCGFLMEELSSREYWHLYRELSGSIPQVASLSDSTVRSKVLAATGAGSWESLTDSFMSYCKAQTAANESILPGSVSHTRPIIENDACVVADGRNWLIFEFTAGSAEPPSGNLMFGPDDRLEESTSAMFVEQYGDNSSYPVHRYGVRFDVNEAGLYDYATNQVVAKYICDLSPSDAYFDSSANRITFRIRKSLIDGAGPTDDDCRLIPLH